MSRVLLVATGPWDASRRQLAWLADALTRRERRVTAIVPSSHAAAWRTAAPTVHSWRELPDDTRARRRLLRTLAEGHAGELAIVDDEGVVAAASAAVSPGGLVLLRLAADAPVPRESFGSRWATRRAPVVIVRGGEPIGDPDGPARPAQDAPLQYVIPVVADDAGAASTEPVSSRAFAAAAVTRESALPEAATASPALLFVPDPAQPLAALPVLRALARLAPHEPTLRAVVDAPGGDMQSLRVHAAALGVADRLVIGARPRAVLAAWVGGEGDAARGVAAATMRDGVPLIVDGAPATRGWAEVAPAGVLALRQHQGTPTPDADALLASELARWLAVPARRERAGTAARKAWRWTATPDVLAARVAHVVRNARARQRALPDGA